MSNSFSMRIKVFLISGLLKLFYWTNSWVVRGRSNYQDLLSKGPSIIFCAWHGQLLSITFDLAKENFHAIAGTHKDAELISQIATRWGWSMLRGSSKEKGDVAYKDMLRVLRKRDGAVFITPDGPTGPARIPKPGVIRAAQVTGAAIIPISVHSTRRWGFTNWDTFFVEKPFGKIFIEYGTPLFFKKDDDFDVCSKMLIHSIEKLEQHKLYDTSKETP
jgi:lysophospholipid acyltransferase (LPLAT)-like uncharacterized protein